MTDAQHFLLQFYPREKECFDVEFDGIPLYSCIRKDLIVKYSRKEGPGISWPKTDVKYKQAIKNILKSFLQLFFVSCGFRRAKTLFVALPRLDNVNGEWLDKFTDPIIDKGLTEDDSYLILDQGRAGLHPKPRRHVGKCIMSDSIIGGGRLYSKLFSWVFYLKNKKEIDALYCAIERAYYHGIISRKELLFNLCYFDYKIKRYVKIYKRLKVQRIIGPARSFLLAHIIASKKVNVPFFECQHGVTYGESITYGGRQPLSCIPDFFLAFGDNEPSNVYGIAEDKIVNIGFAYIDYLKSCKDYTERKKTDVLVLSDPGITGKMLDAISLFAEEYPDVHFYFRPHPHEFLDPNELNVFDQFENIHLMDNKVSLLLVVQEFLHVVGESSTALYESLAMGRKVGKIRMFGMNPQYLKSDDRDYFWEIQNIQDFNMFISSDIRDKKTRSIYSCFNKALFRKTVGLS